MSIIVSAANECGRSSVRSRRPPNECRIYPHDLGAQEGRALLTTPTPHSFPTPITWGTGPLGRGGRPSCWDASRRRCGRRRRGEAHARRRGSAGCGRVAARRRHIVCCLWGQGPVRGGQANCPERTPSRTRSSDHSTYFMRSRCTCGGAKRMLSKKDGRRARGRGRARAAGLATPSIHPVARGCCRGVQRGRAQRDAVCRGPPPARWAAVVVPDVQVPGGWQVTRARGGQGQGRQGARPFAPRRPRRRPSARG